MAVTLYYNNMKNLRNYKIGSFGRDKLKKVSVLSSRRSSLKTHITWANNNRFLSQTPSKTLGKPHSVLSTVAYLATRVLSDSSKEPVHQSFNLSHHILPLYSSSASSHSFVLAAVFVFPLCDCFVAHPFVGCSEIQFYLVSFIWRLPFGIKPRSCSGHGR